MQAGNIIIELLVNRIQINKPKFKNVLYFFIIFYYFGFYTR